jgi:hypothetical protein
MAGELVSRALHRRAARPGVEASVDARTAPIEPLVDVLAASIEAPIDAITAPVEMARGALSIRSGGAVGCAVQTTIHAIAAHIEPLFDAIATAVEPFLDPIAACVGADSRGADLVSRCRTGGKERNEPECHYSLSHGLLLWMLRSSTPRTPRRPPGLTLRGLCHRDGVCIFLKSARPGAHEAWVTSSVMATCRAEITP